MATKKAASSKKKVVKIDWKACDSLPRVPSDQHTQIQVKKASIPLIFVPGIMGSRLERSDNSFCWDPNATYSMYLNYAFKGGEDRKTYLIDDPNTSGTRRVMSVKNGTNTDDFKKTLRDLWIKKPWFGKDTVDTPKWTWLPPSIAKLQGEELANKMVDLVTEQGWMEVAWGFYGDFLLALAETTFHEFKRIFHHPVYAVGYDWVKDNRLAGALLTQRIAEIKKIEKSYDRECDQVILISHSMGGLVSRASVVPKVATACSVGDVLGVIHGAQPATGAPAAYRRMRAGFEEAEGFMASRTRAVMGPDSARVVPVLGGCVGGLELLPTKLYTFVKNGKQESAWLEQIEKDGSTGELMPKSGDPYKEIYREDKDFLRLVYDPKLLDPGAAASQAKKRRSDSSDNKAAFLINLGAAEKFHDDLKDTAHAATFIAWGSDKGMATFDHITYRFNPVLKPNDVGGGSDLDLKPPDGSQPSYFKIADPNGPGDQTVPSSSGSSLLKNSLNAFLHNAECKPVSGAMKGFEHSAFYNDPAVRLFVYAAVQELSFHYREDKIGK